MPRSPKLPRGECWKVAPSTEGRVELSVLEREHPLLRADVRARVVLTPYEAWTLAIAILEAMGMPVPVDPGPEVAAQVCGHGRKV